MNNFSRRLLLTGLSVVISSSFAQADLYDDYINSSSKAPFVAFFARAPNNGPGHSYVGLGVEIDNGNTIFFGIYGYYPKDDGNLKEIKAAAFSGPGEVTSKLPDVSWDLKYIVKVDDEKYAAAKAIYEKWASNDPGYQLFGLGGKNCSQFAADVAGALGLQVPSGATSMLPIDFMKKLKSDNGG